MKKTIFSLMLLFAGAVGFTSCISDDDTPNFVYPDGEDISTAWVSEYTEDGFDYLVEFELQTTTTADGQEDVDTLVTLTRTSKDTGKSAQITGGKLVYSKITGVSTVTFASIPRHPFKFIGETLLYIINTRQDGQRNIQMFNKNARKASFYAIPYTKVEEQ